MISQEIKNKVSNAIFALQSQDTLTRLSAIDELKKIGFNHPQIIQSLESVNNSQSTLEVRLAAQDAIVYLKTMPPEGIQKETPQSNSPEITTKLDPEIRRILQEQNEKLNIISDLLGKSLESNGQNRFQFRVNIMDLDMSISSMITLSFKWLIASIPVGIVIGIFVFFISGCLASF
ncbi:MAG: hypothetical protein ACYDH1_17830 [Anaerolineaceae bacterium]